MNPGGDTHHKRAGFSAQVHSRDMVNKCIVFADE